MKNVNKNTPKVRLSVCLKPELDIQYYGMNFGGYFEDDSVDVWVWWLQLVCRWIIRRQLSYWSISRLPSEFRRKSSFKLLCQVNWRWMPWYSNLRRYPVHSPSSPTTVASRFTSVAVIRALWLVDNDERVKIVAPGSTWVRPWLGSPYHLRTGRSG
jgi:hypothetical protein